MKACLCPVEVRKLLERQNVPGRTQRNNNGAIQRFPSGDKLEENSASEQLSSWRSQLPLLRRVALIVYLPVVLLLSVAVIQQRAPITQLFRDLNAVADLPVYAGFYSQLGAVLWSAAAVICLFSWAVLRRAGVDQHWQHFLLAAGALTSLLLVDDLFMVHEAVLPRILPRAQLVMYLFYAATGVAFLIRFRRLILRTDYILLLASLGLLAFSLTTDVWSTLFFAGASETATGYRILVEDGAKLLGIAGWLSYFAIVSAGRINSVLQVQR